MAESAALESTFLLFTNFNTHNVIFQSWGQQHGSGHDCAQKWTWSLSLTWFPLTIFPPFHYPQKRTFCDSSTAKAPSPVRSRTENQGALMKAAAKKKERNVSFAKWRSPGLKKAYPWKKETMKLSTFFQGEAKVAVAEEKCEENEPSDKRETFS